MHAIWETSIWINLPVKCTSTAKYRSYVTSVLSFRREDQGRQYLHLTIIWVVKHLFLVKYEFKNLISKNKKKKIEQQVFHLLKENTILKIKPEACTNTIIKDIFLIKPNE
jgi:hypothetical protein